MQIVVNLWLVTVMVTGVCWASPVARPFAPQTDKRVRIYVAPDPVVFERVSGSKKKELRDTAEDLVEQLRKRRRVVITESSDKADIRVHIRDRRVELRQDRTSHYGGSHVQTQYESRHLIAYRLEKDGNEQDGEHYLVGSLVTWRRVASDLAKALERYATTE